MDASERVRIWFESLSADEQAKVLSLRGEIPLMMARSLDQAGIVVVHAGLVNRLPRHFGYLMPAVVAEFLEERRREALVDDG